MYTAAAFSQYCPFSNSKADSEYCWESNASKSGHTRKWLTETINRQTSFVCQLPSYRVYTVYIHNTLHLGRKYAQTLSIPSEKRTVFRQFWKWNGGYCVYYPSNSFRKTRDLWKTGEYHSDIPRFICEIFNHMTRLDQSSDWIIMTFVCLIVLRCLSTVWSEKRLLLATMYLKTDLHWLQDSGALFLQLSTGTFRSVVNTSENKNNINILLSLFCEVMQFVAKDTCKFWYFKRYLNVNSSF